ncbi:putative retrotransposable element tf2 155 kda protein type 1-like [Lyophyllum shimeji]|uniref:Retrotransposable element tf2 155 kDa protein type 1-like n=1 Tax=Lyophyllum shimeji TaxID=47721 RepID=A0A9P3UPT2_LYOSH|nr:putative retrotransposable element tf2 155 kda protein type 1-like [Lyophyllum shimeji]
MRVERTKIEYLGLIIEEGRRSKCFLGFTNFYRRFIRDFSHHARPLFDLTKADVKFTWGDTQRQAFEALRTAITSEPVLVFPQDDRPFHIEADSSDFADWRGSLQESPDDGKWHPIAFYSKSLSEVERNYEIHDKEMLAIVRALEEWRHFLEGAPHPFEIWTDHKNIEYFRTARKLNRRQARWSLYLSRFNFSLHHRPGRSMGKPDALSRRADHGDRSGDNANIVLLRPELFAIRAVEGVELVGAEKGVLDEVKRGNMAELFEELVATAARELARTGVQAVRSSDWSKRDGLLCFRDRIYVCPAIWTFVDGSSSSITTRGSPAPRVLEDVGAWQLRPQDVPPARWHTISVDFIVELPESNGYDAVMVAVDKLTKRAHFAPTHTTCSALGAARLFLHNVWRHHGLPPGSYQTGVRNSPHSSRTSCTVSSASRGAIYCYHPQTDGQTERVNQELEQYLRVFISERQDDCGAYNVSNIAAQRIRSSGSGRSTM